jgi:hypothetical protein
VLLCHALTGSHHVAGTDVPGLPGRGGMLSLVPIGLSTLPATVSSASTSSAVPTAARVPSRPFRRRVRPTACISPSLPCATWWRPSVSRWSSSACAASLRWWVVPWGYAGSRMAFYPIPTGWIAAPSWPLPGGSIPRPSPSTKCNAKPSWPIPPGRVVPILPARGPERGFPWRVCSP